MIDFTTPMRTYKGEVVEREKGKILTLEDCCLEALQHIFPNEEVAPEEKVKRFKLGIKIAQAPDGHLVLSNDEIALLKPLIGKFWNSLVVGRCYEVLDPVSLA